MHLNVARLKARPVVEQHLLAVRVARELGREHETLVDCGERVLEVAAGEVEREPELGRLEGGRVRGGERLGGRGDQEREVLRVRLGEAVQAQVSGRRG